MGLPGRAAGTWDSVGEVSSNFDCLPSNSNTSRSSGLTGGVSVTVEASSQILKLHRSRSKSPLKAWHSLTKFARGNCTEAQSHVVTRCEIRVKWRERLLPRFCFHLSTVDFNDAMSKVE